MHAPALPADMALAPSAKGLWGKSQGPTTAFGQPVWPAWVCCVSVTMDVSLMGMSNNTSDQPLAGDPKGSNAGETPLDVAAQHIASLLRADGAKASVMEGAKLLAPLIRGKPADFVGSIISQITALVCSKVERNVGFIAKNYLKLASKAKVDSSPEAFVQVLRNSTDSYVGSGIEALKADLKRDLDDWVLQHVEELCEGIEAAWVAVLRKYWPGDI